MNIPHPGPHLDHMLKQTREHHVALSSMADLKANILMTLSSVVLTITASHLSDAQTRVAALILIFFCLLTMIFAVYTVMPKVSLRLRRKGKPDVGDPNFNLLFFSDYLRLDYGEYLKAMEKMMSQPSLTYEMQVRELYTLGRFLAAKKYRFVRLSYLAFLVGVFASGVVLIVGGLMRWLSPSAGVRGSHERWHCRGRGKGRPCAHGQGWHPDPGGTSTQLLHSGGALSTPCPEARCRLQRLSGQVRLWGRVTTGLLQKMQTSAAVALAREVGMGRIRGEPMNPARRAPPSATPEPTQLARWSQQAYQRGRPIEEPLRTRFGPAALRFWCDGKRGVACVLWAVPAKVKRLSAIGTHPWALLRGSCCRLAACQSTGVGPYAMTREGETAVRTSGKMTRRDGVSERGGGILRPPGGTSRAAFAGPSVPRRRDNSHPLLFPHELPLHYLLKQLPALLPLQVPLPSLRSGLVPKTLTKNQLPRHPPFLPTLGVQIVRPQASFRILRNPHVVAVYLRRIENVQIVAAHSS